MGGSHNIRSDRISSDGNDGDYGKKGINLAGNDNVDRLENVNGRKVVLYRTITRSSIGNVNSTVAVSRG